METDIENYSENVTRHSSGTGPSWCTSQLSKVHFSRSWFLSMRINPNGAGMRRNTFVMHVNTKNTKVKNDIWLVILLDHIQVTKVQSAMQLK